MKKMRPYILILSVILMAGSLSAQRNIGTLFMKNEDRGDKMFNDLYFEQATIYYQLALKKKEKDGTKIKLAETYRRLRDYDSAVKWYGEVLEGDTANIEAIDKYHYGEALLSQGKIGEATKWFLSYQSDVAGDSRSSRKILGIENFLRLIRDSATMEIVTLPFNSEFADFGSSTYDGGLVFASARGKSSFVDPDYLREEDLLDLYSVKEEDAGGWSEPRSFDHTLNTQYHEGPVTFFKDGKKLIITKSNLSHKKSIVSSDGKTKLQLYLVQKGENGWSDIKRMDINKGEYSMAHPSLNQNNDTLYFSSDIPGGFGGSDLYVSTLVDGKWTNVKNLGDVVNTEGDEMYPFYVDNRLFFASTGHYGLGGLDVYKAFMEDGEVKKVVNLGYPINTNADDFGVSIDPGNMKGYLSSNRTGGTGDDDIYGFSINAHVLSGKAIGLQNGEPLVNVSINLFENGKLVGQTKTDKNGQFYFHVPFSTDLEIKASRDGVFDSSVSLTTKGNQLDLDTAFIKMRLRDLFVKGIVYDNQTQEGLENSQLVLHNLTENSTHTYTTGSDGTYEFSIKPDQEFKLVASKYHFVPDSIKFTSFGKERGDILNDMVLDEEYVDKEVIFFDYNEYRIKSESRPVLNKVVKIMKQFPNDYLIIGAHADARGTVERNQELSDQRAEATVQYMVSKGVKRSKIIARGFGEAFIINRCTDGANCEEEDHSKNRRTELTVEKDLPEEELKN